MPRSDALGRGAPVSSQRTYRYVRVSLCAAVLLLGVGVVWHLIALGPLRSISAAYYTPARSVFVGALVAVAVALVVLAGRSVRRYLLLLAGMIAPIIALVPVPLDAGELPGAGCADGAARCLPAGTVDEVAVGMLAYLTVSAAVLAASVVFLALDRSLDRWAVLRCGIAALLLAAVGLWSTQPSFGLVAHYAAAGAFFVLIAAVAGIHAAEVGAEGVTGPGSPVVYARCYAALAALIALVEVLLIALVATGSGASLLGDQWLLIGEAAALALFAAFWVLQTVENWDEPDATVR
ncbi:hypothetical protein GRS96_15440 [Rathayibacter sp. VKM Ac-2803]|uniref:hypothetical protein n=1 Tax=unclassified Rathayibacter TaxID=2609250 RepID=UPI001356DB6F|nr:MULTISPECIES: hypothetical protein [unclassified Rathayibacter]MWV50667.1 hypothetical protein [Rathayibacter sp. VKM Ac-2803]MWV59667.1 hypothetical protein [Rathayibacter sp. VKM Ac-2754]